MVRILNNLTRVCIILSFFVGRLHSMEEVSPQPVENTQPYVIARVTSSVNSFTTHTEDYKFNETDTQHLYAISPKDTKFIEFFICSEKTKPRKEIYLGSLKDFKKTQFKKYEVNRLEFMKKLLKIKNVIIRMEALATMADVLISQECSLQVIEPFYHEINKAYKENRTSFFEENIRLHAKTMDLQACHNNIIINLHKDIPFTTNQLINFIKFFEYLGSLHHYPTQDKAQKDAISLCLSLAEKLESQAIELESQKMKLESQHTYQQAYFYYKKASNQTIIPSVGIQATSHLIYYVDNSTPLKRLFGEVDDFGCLFKDQIPYKICKH